ncbi:AraC family transcriptional regulator [Rhodanobacter sp. BL-MT-08]
MDAFSKVIDLAGVRGSLDLRCLLSGHFALDHAPASVGEAPFHLVLAGRARMQLPDGETLALEAGDFVLLPRGSAHLMQGAVEGAPANPLRVDLDGPLPIRRNTDAAAELDLLCGRFLYTAGAGDLIMRALPDALHLRLAQGDDMSGLHGIVDLLRDEVARLQHGALAIVTALSQALFVMALRVHAQRERLSPSLLLLLADARLGRAVFAMLQHPEHAWTVASLAEQATMSRASFARHFAASSDQSPLELLTLLRMQMARKLLAHGQLATAAVGERVGYQSEAAFSKVFTHCVGMTPAMFRREQRIVEA